MDVFEFEGDLVLSFPDGMRRNVAELFKVKGGLLFFDVWWLNASFHPIHFLEGEVKGDNPWSIGYVQILPLEEDMGGERPFAMWDEKERWKEYLKSEEGQDATRAVAKSLINPIFYQVIE